MKTCSKCGKSKSLDEFYKSKTSKDRHKSQCRVCDLANSKAWREKDPDHARRLVREADKRYRENQDKYAFSKRLRKYGLTLEEYDRLLQLYGGLCHICKLSPATCIDHCHTSFVVRGLLCSTCNQAIGLLYDNVDTLKQAIEYLSSHSLIR